MSHIIIHYRAFAEILKGCTLFVPAYRLTKDHWQKSKMCWPGNTDPAGLHISYSRTKCRVNWKTEPSATSCFHKALWASVLRVQNIYSSSLGQDCPLSADSAMLFPPPFSSLAFASSLNGCRNDQHRCYFPVALAALQVDYMLVTQSIISHTCAMLPTRLYNSINSTAKT